jgi:Flp pilus assembly protein TadG
MYSFQVLESTRILRRHAARIMPKRLRRDQSGAVAVEFGLVALPFFTMIFAIMQIALLYFSDQLLTTAVSDAARMIRTGQAATAGWGVTQFNAQVCTELYSLLDCTKLQTYVTTSSSFSAAVTTPPVNLTTGAYTSSPSYDSNANSASQIVVVSTYYEYPTLFSSLGLSVSDQANGTRLLGAVAAFRNEPFP